MVVPETPSAHLYVLIEFDDTPYHGIPRTIDFKSTLVAQTESMTLEERKFLLAACAKLNDSLSVSIYL